ncbi:MAG: hypothetical protein K2F99_08600, partial [Muribaculaceae bacterium]|nr:hypothetical protein [Muribaculaceae bacterium]
MLKDVYASRISAALTPQVTKDLEKAIVRYVDKNSEIIMSLDLSRRFSFADSDRAVLYDACKISQSELEASIKVSKQIYSGNKIQSNPFYILSILVASNYLQKKDEKMANVVITYMSLNMWTSLHKGFFKYEANKQVMDYTLAHLNNTFSIRNFPSLFAFIQDNTNTLLGTYKDRIVRCNDDDITWVIDSNWTRLKGKIKKISVEFYNNHKSGRYLNSDTESFNQDGYREMDNESFAIDRLTNKVYIKLLNRQYDKRLIKYAVQRADTSYEKLVHLIEDIIDADGANPRLRTVVSSMIELYLTQSGKPISYIAKGDYIAYMQTAFGSNTEAPQMKVIKTTIDAWLDENMYK